ncbi:hypothetical protein PM10SUCC1_15490 [Propionigenium maris DSM 9537]|uniref:Uncharacterized protein n=1 Tax=Propionigenium maris DSM 9537 TaxID=1123000 RepID=A0A9W6GKV8_9FUSO|nr:hypothetical protein PM10SUCC1_15490 [Propionigenium maris DSM 9537]
MFLSMGKKLSLGFPVSMSHLFFDNLSEKLNSLMLTGVCER